MTTTEPVDLMSPELLADPWAGFARLREQAPLLSASLMGGPPTWLVTRYADVREVLTDPRFRNDVSSIPGGTDMRTAIMARLNIDEDLVDLLADNILRMDGADHTRVRKLVSRAFTVRRVSELRPRVEEITTALLDGLAGTVDLVESFCYPLPITVICELVGIDEADRPQWHEWGRDLIALDPKRIPTVLRQIVDQVQDVIARRRAEPRDDLVSALISAQEADGDRLTDREMITLVIALVIAGHETTAHLLGNSVPFLLTHPDQLARLRADPALWPQAVNELMRLRGPVQFGQARYPCEDVELGGTTIPAGSPVTPVLTAANSDPREFGDAAATLDVGRETGRAEGHLGFGQGVHYCLGAALARQEAEVALRALFERFGDLALAVPAAELRWYARPGLGRLVELPLTGFGVPVAQ